jgi:DDE superfamily endonuclease
MALSHLPPHVSALFYALAHCLDRRLQGRFGQLLLGVLFARGRRTVTSWFRAAGIGDDFRQGYRTVHAAGRHVESLALRVLPVVRDLEPGHGLTVALDDTPTPRWGPCVEGAGIHHNPNPGPAGEKYVYGHIWVTLAGLVQHPHEGVRALPLRADLYVRVKDVTPELTAQGWQFQTKLELAGQQLRWLHTWADPSVTSICVVADGAYAKRPLLRVVRALSMTLVSRLAKNAALWSLPPTRRRPRQPGPLPTYGKTRIDLAKRAGQTRGWQEVECIQYGEIKRKRIKTFLATWRPAGGMIRVVLVMEEEGWRAYFSTDVNLRAGAILEKAADRGAIEQTFKDIKEVWGAGQQQVRNVQASVGAFNINAWMYSIVESWGWPRTHEQLVDRQASPWDEADRRASHADKRKALRREVLRAETLAALAEGPGSEGFQRLLAHLLDWAA